MHINLYNLRLSGHFIDMAPKIQTARGKRHISWTSSKLKLLSNKIKKVILRTKSRK